MCTAYGVGISDMLDLCGKVVVVQLSTEAAACFWWKRSGGQLRVFGRSERLRVLWKQRYRPHCGLTQISHGVEVRRGEQVEIYGLLGAVFLEA